MALVSYSSEQMASGFLSFSKGSETTFLYKQLKFVFFFISLNGVLFFSVPWPLLFIVNASANMRIKTVIKIVSRH